MIKFVDTKSSFVRSKLVLPILMLVCLIVVGCNAKQSINTDIYNLNNDVDINHEDTHTQDTNDEELLIPINEEIDNEQNEVFDDEYDIEEDESNIPNKDEVSIWVISERSDIRKDPTLESEIIDVVLKDQNFKMISEFYDNDEHPWYEIEINNQNGWIDGFHCSVVKDDNMLGKYISSYDITDANTLMVTYTIDDLDEESIEYKPDVFEDSISSYSIENLTKATYLTQVQYSSQTELTMKTSNLCNVYNPMFIDNNTLLYLVAGSDLIVYLVKFNIDEGISEVLYTVDLKPMDPFHISFFGTYLDILSVNDKHVSYRLNNDLLIYSTETDEVEKHFRYDDLFLKDVSSDGSEIIIESYDKAYVTSYDLSETSVIFSDNGLSGESLLSPSLLFSNLDASRLLVRLAGWEWVTGMYVFDRDTSNIFELKTGIDSIEVDNYFWDWEEVIEYGDNNFLIYKAAYGGYDYLPAFTSVLFNLSTLMVLDSPYYLFNGFMEIEYDIGIPMYDTDRNFVFYNIDNNTITQTSGLSGQGEIVCCTKEGDTILYLDEDKYYIYSSE